MNEKIIGRLREMYFMSILITFSKIGTSGFQAKDILYGKPLGADNFLLTLYVVMSAVLILVPNNHWRKGILFIFASSLLEYYAGICAENSYSLALAVNIGSILVALPAFYFFHKIKHSIAEEQLKA